MLPFLPACDPLGGNTGSIDSLPAIQTYGGVGDTIAITSFNLVECRY